MLTCPNCHASLEDGARFCDSCGAQIPTVQAPEPKPIYCPHCGKPTTPENLFCPECGKPLNGTDTKPSPTPKIEEKKSKKRPKTGVILAVLGVVVVAALVCVFVFSGSSTGGSSKNYALYIKDKEIYYTGFSKNDPRQVTSNLLDGDNFDNYDLAVSTNVLGAACQLSEDGSLLFFPDRVGYYDDGFSLYYRNIKKQKEEAVKIDSDILSYSVSKDASAITYLKNDTLYQYDRKKDDKQKVASDIQRYFVSDDGKTILYLNSENVLYCTVRGGDREKIDSDIASLDYVSEDLSLLLYIKDGTLYQKKNGKDKVKISSDVESVITSYDSGEVYYVKADAVEVPLMDYVYDDKKEADASLTEPKAPSWSDPDYDAKYEVYEQEYEEYRAKVNRDSFRESLESQKIQQKNYTLCYYDGEETTTITDSFTYSSYAYATDKPVITYTAYDQSDDIGIKLSDLEGTYEVNDMVTEALYSAAERYISVGSTATSLDLEEAMGFFISSDGKKLYYLDEIPEGKDYGELYQVNISSSGELEAPEVYDTDVYTDSIHLVGDDKLLYFKDYKNDKGELYIDKEKIDYDVDLYSVHYDKNNDCITYFIDWSSDKSYGTLKVFHKKEAKKIADDVHSYFSLPNGNILYLYDYSQKYYHGDLYLWDKKDTEKIDDSVVCIIPVY